MDMARQKEYDNTLVLVEIVNHLKGLHTILSSVMLDTAALRQTVLAGKSERAKYSDRVKAGAEIGRPLLEEALRSYDQMIERIRDAQEAEEDEALAPDFGTPVLH
jgi:restriction endonuclease Mrr